MVAVGEAHWVEVELSHHSTTSINDQVINRISSMRFPQTGDLSKLQIGPPPRRLVCVARLDYGIVLSIRPMLPERPGPG